MTQKCLSIVDVELVLGFNLRVSDIFSLPSLPKVLCCMSTWNNAENGVFLEENEIIVIKGVS